LVQGPWHRRWGFFFAFPDFMTGAVRRRHRNRPAAWLIAALAANFGVALGFASMDAEKQRAIARKGGRSVPDEKRSFSQNRQLASAAGRKGGYSSHGNRHSGQDKNQPFDTVKP
jgi:uncharacterized protein